MEYTNLKVLVLEDSPVDAEIIQRLLLKTKIDYRFTLATDRADFVQALDEFQPDVILSDNSMPGFNASEALKIVRSRSMYIPFILVTGTVSDEYAASIIRQGADDYVLKDRMTRLPAAIDSALRFRRAEKEKQEAAWRLKQSEENYRMIMERISDAFVAIDKNWNYTYVNRQAGDIMGRSPESLIGKNIWEEFPGAVGNLFYHAYHRAMETQRYISLDEFYEPFNVWLENHIYPSPDGLSIFFRNISDRKIAEQQKEFDRNNLAALINNTRDQLWSVDRNLKLITFNETFDRIVRMSSGRPLTKGNDVLGPQFTEDQRARYRSYYERALSGEIFTIIDHLEQPGLWVEISFYPIHQGNEVIGTACFSRDITERKRAEEELKKLEAALFEQQRQEQLKITETAHEAQEKERNAIGMELHDNVNQILVGTKLLLSLARSEPSQAEQLLTECMNNLQQAIEENRKIAHELVAPDFDEKYLSDQLIHLAATMLKPQGIEVNFEDGDFDESMITGRQKLSIYRIAQEQCTNIVKYAKARRVNIHLVTNSNFFTMSIKDDGVGMESGKQVSGIGITNIKGRLSVFNGAARIETSPGNGFMMEITIPLEHSVS